MRLRRGGGGGGSGGPLLVLFDIDGTLLLRASAVHAEALFGALRDVHGLLAPERAMVDAGGRTDGEIARLILLQHDIAAERIDDRVASVREAACLRFSETCPDDLSEKVAPGMADLLARLAPRSDYRLSLLTGNYEPVARLKLARAGIGRYFPPGQGAFGSDSEDRAALPEIARRRARTPDGKPHPRSRTVVVGDTPRDIACARADGVECVAVTTGRFGRDELRGARVVVDDAAGVGAALAELATGRSSR